MLMKKRFHTEPRQRVFIVERQELNDHAMLERPDDDSPTAWPYGPYYTVRNMARDAFARKKPIFWWRCTSPPYHFITCSLLAFLGDLGTLILL